VTVNFPAGDLIINGKRIRSEKTLPVISPSTEEIVGEISAASEKEVALAVEAAAEAFKEWKLVSLKHRLGYIGKFRNELLKRIDELAYIDAAEAGHPLGVGVGEVCYAAMIAKYYEKFAADFLKEEKMPSSYPFNLISQFRKSYRVFEPLGVIGIISPWNIPIILSLAHIIPSLAAGNTVVFKPSMYSTFVSLKLCEIFEEVGLPPGVLNVVTGSGEETGIYLTSANVQKISFTGSGAAAVSVLENCAKNLTPASMELGGCDAMIVLKDANLDNAASAAVFGTFWNSGQICIASKRLMVDNQIKDEFLKKILTRVKKLRVGDPLLRDTDIGPLINRAAVEKTDNFVKDAVLKGAKIEIGGKKIEGKGFFYEPTVLSKLNMSMLLTYEERFGPVMSVIGYDSMEEAIAMANYTEYGLSSSIWSRDIKKAREIESRISSGFATINSVSDFAVYSPFGGTKRSGFGRSLSKEGLRDVTLQKTVEVIEREMPIVNPFWFPWTAASEEILTAIAKFFFIDGLKGKIGLLIKVLGSMVVRQREYRDFIKPEPKR
jgi:acyl-CoA reductase-like NAD-dependent aldehyde dehydrogenase